MRKTRDLSSGISVPQKVGLVLFGMCLFFVLLEVSLRLGGQIMGFTQEQRNLQVIKHKSTYRILCLGESTTEGQYPLFLEDILNQSGLGISFSVINKGRMGTNSTEILSRLEAYLAKYRPDMVVVMMGVNDRVQNPWFVKPAFFKLSLFISGLRTYKLIRLLELHFQVRTQKNYLAQIPTEEALKQAIKSNPKDERALFELMFYYREQSRPADAVALLDWAIKQDPKNVYIDLGLGYLYWEQGKLTEAEGMFKKVLRLNPEVYQVYIDLGWLYRQAGRFPEAIAVLGQAIKLNPSYYEAYLNLGLFYQEQGDFLAAEQALHKAIALDSKKGGAYGALSVLYAKTGRLELSGEYEVKANAARFKNYPVLVSNYLRLKSILERKGILLVCVQYPMRSVEPLKQIFRGNSSGIIFVDNESIFKQAVAKEGFNAYFRDIFGGDFGHCTSKGNRLLAGNIAEVIRSEYLDKEKASSE